MQGRLRAGSRLQPALDQPQQLLHSGVSGRLRVRFEDSTDQVNLQGDTTAADGSFAITGLEDREYQLHGQTVPTAGGDPLDVVLGVAQPSDSPLEVEWPD